MKHFKGIMLSLLAFLVFSTAFPAFAQEDDDDESCTMESHPVANALADEFDVDVSDIVDLHCAGNGFGNIVRIYLLAELGDTSVDGILDMRADGMGWGRIARELGVHPRDIAPGRVFGAGDDSHTNTCQGESCSPLPEHANEIVCNGPAARHNPHCSGNGNNNADDSNPRENPTPDNEDERGTS